MKRFSPRLAFCGLTTLGLFLTALPLLGTVGAAPRIGAHQGYTRLVFDLPGPSTVKTALGTGAKGNKVLTLTLTRSLKSEHGTLAEPGVTSYVTEGRTVSLQLAAGVRSAEAVIFPAGGGQPDRLVVDVPLPTASTAAAARPGKAPVSKAPTAKAPASKVAPVKAPTTARVPARPPTIPVVRPASTARRPDLVVVLDPGHGGIDSGMVSPWVVEKNVTLDVAMRVRTYLQGHGVKVIMVRSSDTQLSVNKKRDLESRSRLATAGTVNAYISIHVNSGNSAASGIETFYFGQPLDGSNRSLAVRENGDGSVGQELTRAASSTAQGLVGDLLSQVKLAFSAQLARNIQTQLVSQTGAEDRGVRSDALYVIQNPTVPAILTEIGFGSSPTEGPKLAQAGYRDRVAGAIAAGILKFLKVP